MNQKLWLALWVLAFIVLCVVCLGSHRHESAAATVTAPNAAVSNPVLEGRMENGKLTLSGAVPSIDAKKMIAARARALFGVNKVVDDVSVDTTAPNGAWGAGVANITSVLGGRLTDGSFRLGPDSITIRGQVPGEDIKAAILHSAQESVGPRIRIIDALTVVAKSAAQTGIDDFLKGKVIEFATSSSGITPKGRDVLDQLLPLLRKADGRVIEIGGHTDNEGSADLNMRLSNDRAYAVKRYLMSKGMPPAKLNPIGFGSTRPVADNSSEEGRQQNRRIEFAIQ